MLNKVFKFSKIFKQSLSFKLNSIYLSSGFEKFRNQRKKNQQLGNIEKENTNKNDEKDPEIPINSEKVDKKEQEIPIESKEIPQNKENNINTEKKDLKVNKDKKSYKTYKRVRNKKHNSQINEEPKNTNEKEENDNKEDKDKNPENPNDNKYRILMYSIAGYFFINYIVKKNKKEMVTFKELEYFINNDRINYIQVKNDRDKVGNTIVVFNIILKDKSTIYMIVEEDELELILAKIEDLQRNQNKKPGHFIKIYFSYNSDRFEFSGFDIIKNFFFIFFFYSLYGLKRKNISLNIFNDMFNKKKNNNIKVFTKTNVKFENVAGLSQAKTELKEFVEFLKKPDKFKKLGAKIPKGALLNGPPGNGKTYLAKAIAGEANVPFFYASGSEFVEMYVGVGASRVRKLFKEAKKKSPSIIFIDEIDAVGKKRSNGMGGNDEIETTLNQILVEMDGFEENNSVIVLGATNRIDILDKALLRPGRFDRIIDITAPEIKAREEIFVEHLKSKVLESDIKELSKRLATLTPGFSCAEISNICNEGAIIAARESLDKISDKCFELAVEKVIAGIEKKNNLSAIERETVAVHECGHAIVSWFLKGGSPLVKLTVIPRSKGSLGFAQYLPNESHIKLKEEIIDEIKIALGGRQAELLFFNKITTGASNDLQKVYQLAREYVVKFGFSDKIGLVSYSEDKRGKKIYGESMNAKIDLEIDTLIKKCSEETLSLLETKKEYLLNLKQLLLDKQILTYKEIKEVLGERPFVPSENFKRYLEEIEDKIEITNKLETNNA